MFNDYFEALQDPQEPTNRIIRKAAVIAALCVLYFVYQKHVVLSEGFDSAHWTALNAIAIYLIVGPLGGTIAAEIYDSHLRSVKATNDQPNSSTFFIECLLALTAPILGYIMFVLLFGGMNWRYA